MINLVRAYIPRAILMALCILILSSSAFGAATIVILNNDSAGVGFNDPTAATPVGNNTGTTVGQQRLNAFQFAANLWGASLNSTATITVRANWAPLTCSSMQGALAQAGSAGIFRNFPGAPFPNTWYSASLANSLAGVDLDTGTPEISLTINSNLGNTGCLDGTFFYLGLDNNHGNNIDLVTILLHEFAHGFGFQTFTSGSTGTQTSGSPSIYDKFLHDDTTGKDWNQMTDAERQASAKNNGKLVWTGPLVTSLVPTVLGTPRLKVNSPGAIAGNYTVGTAAFGSPLTSSGVAGNLAQTIPNDACTAISNGSSITGKVALIDRGNCNFVVKVKNAQNAGAIAAIVYDATDLGVVTMGGGDSTINISSVLISHPDGNTLKGQINAPVNATLLVDTTVPQGADAQSHALMNAPLTFAGGSSVSHWDPTEYPNQLMEPSDSGDLTHSLAQPYDLTIAQLRDVGWSANPIGDVPFFVRQHYLDFLSRQPDSSGLGFWISDIFNCGIDKACAEVHRINTSAAFFLSIEFQQTGYLVERLYKASYGDADATSTYLGTHTLKVPIVRLSEFQAGKDAIGQGVQVGVGNWQAQLETNKQNFIAAFVLTPRFAIAYPTSLTPAQFVTQMNNNIGGVMTPVEQASAVARFGAAIDTSNTAARALALRDVAENATFSNQSGSEFKRAFVLMQFYGYLQRNPDDLPDRDFTGYDFWLTKLVQFGNYQDAQMVKAFIDSVEYKKRF